MIRARLIRTVVCALALTTTVAHAADPLAAWDEGPAKQSIMEFVEKVTQGGSSNFVPNSRFTSNYSLRLTA